MIKTDIHLPPHWQYESATEFEPLDFFSECLCNSKRFDLKLGFFSSSAIYTLSDGFALFLHNGGTMRLIINNILSSQDKNAIIVGTTKNPVNMFDLSDIASLKNTISENDKHFFDCLAWLITEKKIEIKVITPKDTEVVAHTKKVIFADERNTVGFNGSCNFSRTALLENKESIDVNCDWDGEISNAKLKNIFQFCKRKLYKVQDKLRIFRIFVNYFVSMKNKYIYRSKISEKKSEKFCVIFVLIWRQKKQQIWLTFLGKPSTKFIIKLEKKLLLNVKKKVHLKTEKLNWMKVISEPNACVGKRGRGAGGKIPVFGMLKRNGKVSHRL